MEIPTRILRRTQLPIRNVFMKAEDKFPSSLTTGEDLCFQAEADTAMFTIYSALRSDGYTAAIELDTEDSDNYVQAACCSEDAGDPVLETQTKTD
jgi:hypothetical protein